MFLIFGLARPDVWSPGDLGLRRSAEFFFNSADASVADRWRPYRSIAAWYLWEHSDQLQGRIV
jgi:3-methyladenine DNA glycosylase/8-oxoguanine DNA glycosylase